ncbi:hypothetical protein HPB51_009319 [Rhipicephalus microplus]|uniref:THAP-type domain-containing protein n=1 Tax=Rhipicephalus microplus TaxID=6941 RepID=A0A9J6F0N1_RHIMP|nr:hypothetical protein HPB51_009319 [Rhipicephalus microplus]
MAYCCVPLYKSDEKKKPAGLSFHELPADADARARWLAAIRRDKWSPNTTSCYTKICSRHFKEDDFIEGKQRRLTKGAVPSVFEEYTPNLQPKSTPARNTASINKRVSAAMARSDSASGNVASAGEDMSDCCAMNTLSEANLRDQGVQFLAHDIGPKGEVSSCYIKKLYDLQKDLVVKPVSYLSRKMCLSE